MPVAIKTSVLFAALLCATFGCNSSENTNPIPVPAGVVIELYEVAAAPGNNTRTAVDPTTGNPIDLVTPPLIVTNDIDTIAQQVDTNQPGQPMLKISLTPGGGQKMLAATSKPTASKLALVVNGKVVAVAQIMVPIQDSMVLSGDYQNPGFEMARKIFAGE
ncbi:preprotein translocase subunit SecD [Bremerella volcania]|uniref:Preprotein translocase subunit SecD n=1 Tax=Bremerella volcania TaxID=2527984 RepID=A0A518CFU0_9BACT|nr:hypothetical protein [Bremerella volcania]QDU78089.1 preprotein translocase subunit SecD [Bremerella volcania]